MLTSKGGIFRVIRDDRVRGYCHITTDDEGEGKIIWTKGFQPGPDPVSLAPIQGLYEAFTDRRDSDANPIFENDIITWPGGDKARVFWDCSQTGWAVCLDDGFDQRTLLSDCSRFNDIVKIIGRGEIKDV